MRTFLKFISFSSALLLAGNSAQIYSSEPKKIDIKSNILISNLIEEKEIKTVLLLVLALLLNLLLKMQQKML